VAAAADAGMGNCGRGWTQRKGTWGGKWLVAVRDLVIGVSTPRDDDARPRRMGGVHANGVESSSRGVLLASSLCSHPSVACCPPSSRDVLLPIIRWRAAHHPPLACRFLPWRASPPPLACCSPSRPHPPPRAGRGRALQDPPLQHAFFARAGRGRALQDPLSVASRFCTPSSLVNRMANHPCGSRAASHPPVACCPHPPMACCPPCASHGAQDIDALFKTCPRLVYNMWRIGTTRSPASFLFPILPPLPPCCSA
jgi:hypothetical protein